MHVLTHTQVIRRNWTVGETSSGAPIGVMQPLLDMINHDRASANTLRYDGDCFQLVHEGEGIAAGDEVRNGSCKCTSVSQTT